MLFIETETQDGVLQVGGHGNMVLGMWSVRCLKSIRGDAEGELDVEQRGHSWRESDGELSTNR